MARINNFLDWLDTTQAMVRERATIRGCGPNMSLGYSGISKAGLAIGTPRRPRYNLAAALEIRTSSWMAGSAGNAEYGNYHFKNGRLRMRITVKSVSIAMTALTSVAHGQSRIDAISTQFRWLGPNDKIVVERYDDPKVRNVSCYMSRADTGGIKGAWAWPKIQADFLSPAGQLGRSRSRTACRSPR